MTASSLLDKDFRFRFGNNEFMQVLRLPPEVAAAGNPCEDIIRLQAAARRFRSGRGRRGHGARTARNDARPGRRALRAADASSGTYVEFNFKPLADGGLLGGPPRHHRAEGARGGAGGRQGGGGGRARRRRAHARDHADRARQHERRRRAHDSMGDDRAGRIRQPAHDGVPALSGRRSSIPGCIDDRGACASRSSAATSARSRTSRQRSRSWSADLRTPGGDRFERPHGERPLHRVQLQAARGRNDSRHPPRHHRAEGARGSARRRQGSRRSRARRRRAHPRGDADRARQHERRRHAVRQELPLAVHQPSACRAVGLHAGRCNAGHVRLAT